MFGLIKVGPGHMIKHFPSSYRNLLQLSPPSILRRTRDRTELATFHQTLLALYNTGCVIKEYADFPWGAPLDEGIIWAARRDTNGLDRLTAPMSLSAYDCAAQVPANEKAGIGRKNVVLFSFVKAKKMRKDDTKRSRSLCTQLPVCSQPTVKSPSRRKSAYCQPSEIKQVSNMEKITKTMDHFPLAQPLA